MGTVKIIASLGDCLAEAADAASVVQSAIQSGAAGVQVDVHLDADGHAVCFRDWAPRLAEAAAPAEAPLRLDQLIRQLEEARTPLILALELRHRGPAATQLDRAVLEALASAGWDSQTGTVGQVQISPQSFNPLSFQALCPPVPARNFCMMLGDTAADITVDESPGDEVSAAAVLQSMDTSDSESSGRITVDALELIDAGAVGVVGPPASLVRREPQTMRGWADKGMVLRAWSVGTREDFQACVEAGVTEVVTDSPAALGWNA